MFVVVSVVLLVTGLSCRGSCGWRRRAMYLFSVYREAGYLFMCTTVSSF